MKGLQKLSRLAAFVCAALLAACSGGGGGGGPGPSAGIDRLGVTTGVVTGFGSILVNGIRFDTSTADFVIDDAPGMESDLDVGFVVTIIGTIDDDGLSGTARTVIFDETVEGPVEQVIDSTRVVVAGQLVVASASTVFDDDIPGRDLSGINVGDTLEVSGFINTAGAIQATRIDLQDPADEEIEVLGTVSGLDPVGLSFQVGGLTVDYSGAVLDEDFPPAGPADGQLVEARGTILAGGTLTATAIDLEDDFIDEFIDDDDVIEDADLEGLVTNFQSPTQFDVNGIPITTTSQTEFIDGSAGDLADDVRVIVGGFLDSDATVVAETISFALEPDRIVNAAVDSVDAANARLTALGIVVATDAQTLFEDNSDADLEPFDLADINAGDFVRINARETGGVPGLRAIVVDRDDADKALDETELQGLISAVAGTSFTVLGVTIDTDQNTNFNDSLDDVADLNVGDLVRVAGRETGPTNLLAEDVELVDDD